MTDRRARPSLTGRRLVLAVAVAASLVGGVVTSTGRADAFLHLLAKPVVQTISLSVKRGQTYERLEEQRDDQIAEVDQSAAATEWQIANGWLADPAAVARERDRYDALRGAIRERTEREKRITRASYGRAIGATWQEAAINAITQIPGLSPRAGRALQGILRGDSPLEAALAAVTDGGARPDELDVLRAEVEEAKEALRSIRLPQAEGLRGRIELLLASTRDPLGTLRDRSGLDAAAREVREALGQFRAVADEWTVRGARINISRFQRDEQWQRLSAHIAALEQSTAGSALAAGMARQTINRVQAMADRYGVPLTEDQLLRIAAAASAGGVQALVEARRSGGSFDLDFDPIVRGAINEWLATSGQDPLPAPLSGDLTIPVAVRVGQVAEMSVEPHGGGTVTEEPRYEVEWFAEPAPMALSRAPSYSRVFSEPGEQRVRVVVTETVTGETVEAVAVIDILGELAVSLGPLGLFGQSGDIFNPDPETALGSVYAGEIVRYTALVDNIPPGVRPQIEWVFPNGTLTGAEPGLVTPALRAPARAAWYVDHAIDEPGTHLVRVTVIDPQTGTSAGAIRDVTVIEEPEDPNAWHASTSCRVEGEGAGYEFQWMVRISELPDDEFLADITFHDCPGGGRAHYQGEALPHGERWVVPEARLLGGRGRLSLLANQQYPGPLEIVLTPGAAPSLNVVAELGR